MTRFSSDIQLLFPNFNDLNSRVILITCVAIQKFWKKLVKPLKNCFFRPNLHRKDVIMSHAQDGNFFSAEIKVDHQLSERFYFIKIYVLTELWIFFYLEWCFLSKMCHFQRKLLTTFSQVAKRFFIWKYISHYLPLALSHYIISSWSAKKPGNRYTTS